MKTLTRFLETEISGKYALEFYRSLGAIVQQSLDWACYLRTMSFDTMERDELNSLCQTLGVYNPVVEIDGFDSYLTLPRYGTHRESDGTYTGSGVRELKSIESLEWRETGMTGSDINDQASPENRTGLVGHGARVLGYIPYDVQAFDDYGNVKPEAILPSPPPDGKPYSEYYGDKYLYFASSAFVLAFLSDEDLREYLKLMQSLRNGRTSWKAFKDICDFLGIAEILDLSAYDSQYPWMTWIRYSVRAGNHPNRAKRIALFRNIMRLKFPQVFLEDIT